MSTDHVPKDTLTILTASAEFYPFARTGELGDHVGSLTEALAVRGHRVMVFLPRYGCIDPELLRGFEPVHQVHLPMDGEEVTGTVWRGRRPASPVLVYLIEQAELFDRRGIHADPESGEPYADSGRRIVFFCRAVLETLRALKLKPDVIHAHDHAAALIPAYLKTLYCEDSHVREVASVLTIHDLRFQGVHEREFLDLTGLPSDVFHSASPFEFWGKVNVMKAGVCFADLVSTLSPRHAQEITWSEEAGIGLEGVLRERQQDLVGIVSGIDVDTWDPRSDPALTARFSCDALGGKKLCRQDLVQRFGLDDRLAVVALVTPLVEEKGIELLEMAADELLERDVSVVILGTGEGRFESFVRAWRDRRQGRVAAVLGDNEELARQIIAGADLLLMPSRLERCGSTQLHAMRYGTIPVVRAVGGLADTVRDFEPPGGNGNGFTFAGYTAPDLLDALDRALAAWQNPEQRALLIRRGMTRDDSWDRAAAAYVDAFERARERKHRDNPRSWATGAVEQR